MRFRGRCVSIGQFWNEQISSLGRLHLSPRLMAFYHRYPLLFKAIFDLAVIGILFLPYFVIVNRSPFDRIIWRDDRTIMYPMTSHEIFPAWTIPIFCLVIPIIVIFVTLAADKFKNRRTFLVFVGLLLSILITGQVTNILKQMVGRPRPDFLARCNPDPLVTDRLVCRGLKSVVDEGRRSFPSGHTSYSFAGLSYLSLFLAGQFSTFSGPKQSLRLIIVTLPLLLATIVGISRIMDYRHHWQDVLVGALLGLVSAYFSYRVYFPSVMSAKPDELVEYEQLVEMNQSGDEVKKNTSENDFAGVNVM